MITDKILITGGTSTVGQHLKKYLPDAIYLSSDCCDLTSQYQVEYILDTNRPNIVIHLAALVGGIMDNINNPIEYYETNNLMNLNIVRGCYDKGVKKFIGILSTCIYPDKLPDSSYPLKEHDIYNGIPTKTNEGYAYAKRMLGFQLELYKKHRGVDYSYITPCNLYSEYDKFDIAKSHYVTSLLNKIKAAELADQSEIVLMGNGEPLRQFMYADDLAKIIALSIKKNIYENFNMAPEETLTIKEIAELTVKHINPNIDIKFDESYPNGQYRKDVSNEKFKLLFPDFTFTSLERGVKLVYDKISK
jgi:GDP-L-fucose synthase